VFRRGKHDAVCDGIMLIKIHGGTAVQHAESLCDTCRHARIVRGRRLDEELVICSAVVMETIRITFKVTDCSEYSDQREPSYHELLEKAWILQPASKRRPAGFVRAGDLSAQESRRLRAVSGYDGD
jgi:hypothetical protein